MAEAGEAQFEISSVISRSFETITSNLLLFAGLALILAGVPGFALQFWQATTVESATDSSAILNAGYLLALLTGMVVSIVTGAVLQAALTRATVLHLSGEKPGFAQCLAVGLTMILPMIGLGIIVAFGVGFAMLLLIVPGVILWLCWSVAVPAYVQEKIGVFEALGRSVELTRGARWRIFLTMLVVWIGLWLISIPIGLMSAAFQSTGSIVLLSLFSAAVGALGSMVTVAVQSCIYVELRDVKEGVAPSELESIFA